MLCFYLKKKYIHERKKYEKKTLMYIVYSQFDIFTFIANEVLPVVGHQVQVRKETPCKSNTNDSHILDCGGGTGTLEI